MPIFRYLTFLMLASALANAAGAESDDSALREIFEAQAEIRTLQSGFRQTKSLSLFDETLVSTGTLVIEKPDFYCWAYQEPEHTVFYVDGDRSGSFVPGSGVREEIDLQDRRGLASIIRSITPIVSGNLNEASRSEFDISRDPSTAGLLSYTFRPRQQDLRSLIEGVTIRFDKEDHLAHDLQIEEKNGDRTLIEFDEWQVDIPVDRTLLVD